MAYTGAIGSRSNVGELLKLQYDEESQDVINNEVNFWKYAQKLKSGEGGVKLEGEDFVISVQLTQGQAAQSGDHTKVLPGAILPTFGVAKLRSVRVAQAITIDHELKKLARTSAQAFSAKAAALYDDAKNAIVKDLNRQAQGDGSGTIAVCTGNGTGAGAATGTLTVSAADALKFEENALYDVWDTGTGTTMRNTAPAHFKVTAINEATGVLSIAMSDGSNVPAGVVTTDVIVRKGSVYVDGSSARACYEMNGLQKLTGDVDLMGLAKTYRRWNATRYDAGAVGLTALLLGKAQIKHRRRSANEGKINVWWTSPEQALDVVLGAASRTEDVRFTRGDASKLGFDNQNKPTVNYGDGDVQIQTDLDFPANKLIGFSKGSLLVGELHPLQAEQFEAGTFLPVIDVTSSVPGYMAAETMWLVWRGNIGTKRRNEFLEVYNLANPT